MGEAATTHKDPPAANPSLVTAAATDMDPPVVDAGQ